MLLEALLQLLLKSANYIIWILKLRIILHCMETKKKYDLMIKMCFIGDLGVGKTTLLTKAAEDRYYEGYSATIGI